MSRRRWWVEVAQGFATALVAWLSWSAALGTSPARADGDATLAILGLTSDDGDDARAAAVTQALRAQAESEPGTQLSSSRASLPQMTMLHDCDVSDPACRARIGGALGVERVIYGHLRREGSRGHEVELHLFRSSDGEETTARRVIPAADGDAALAGHARALLDALRGVPAQAAPGVRDDGPPPVPTITPDVRPLDQPDPVVDVGEPPEDEVRSSNDWLGYSLLGLAAVSAGLTVFSWTQIESAGDDIADYRTAVWFEMPRHDDVCALAEDDMRFGFDDSMIGDVRDACDRGQTFDVLQYVFLGAALASGALGTYFLLDDEGPPRESAAARFGVRARAGAGSGMLSVRVEL